MASILSQTQLATTHQRLLVNMDFQPAFSSLPGEILIQVLENLDWNDLNAARQVCMSLYDAHQSRSVWTSLIRNYSERYMAIEHACLEKPLGLCSTAELKKRFVQWMKVERLMRPENEQIEVSQPFRIYGTNYQWVGNTKKKEVHIIRGGRWLLYSDKNEILYCDLCQGVPSELLVPATLLTIHTDTKITMLIDEHNHSSQEFTIAILYYRPSGEQRGCWEVYSGLPLLNDQGLNVGLKATFLARVWSPCQIPIDPCRISLLGSHMACSAFFGNHKQLVIVNWRTANGQKQCPFKTIPRKSLGMLVPETLNQGIDLISSICLLPEERILLRGSIALAIYDHSTWSERTSLPPNTADLVQPISHIPLSSQTQGGVLSRFFIAHDSLRIILADGTKLSGLIIRYLPAGQISWEIIKLMDLPESWFTSMHLRKFCFTHYTCGIAWKPYKDSSFRNSETASEVYFLRYFWPEEEDRSSKSRVRKVKFVPQRHIGKKDVMTVDPTSGKVILAYESSTTVTCFSIT